MLKRIVALCLVLTFCFSLTGCICRHEWAAANCAEPSKCINCGKTQGEPLEHVWLDANCTDAKSCILCSTSDGQPLGHDWAEADCLNPASCTRCSATEGESLGHDWQHATTEAPQTCLRCALTEGEPIVTDPRFKTAPAAELIGKWKFDTAISASVLSMPNYDKPIRIRFILDFAPDGTFIETAEILDEEVVMDELIRYSMELTYLELEANGISRESYDAMVLEQTGMSNYDYTKYYMGNVSLNGIIDYIFTYAHTGGVYYVEDDTLYTGLTWESPMFPSSYVVDDRGLWAESFDGELGYGTVFTPMTEE